ncbi:uncharacterized protein HMPREF1541_05673 [Cyphellophora europaea CBS 101466]|uniref:Magnesium transporter protein 1 n=1 Tax=Cyphellophora europaea (strain CBS 101466) TaxID=1220924 RepID=W2RT18_CYPE1|nr:uncharacterized protein HMPREF1541_05673 [Cyphellophora europaea CBS 101466]ETN39450.1 hypothetical protein HMPREF1541_05673 [Cyphellophora europaea CBS 101466]
MRLLNLITLALVPLTALAAKKSSPFASPFDTFVSKPFPVEIDEHSYETLTAVPRDHYTAVLLTARPAKYACALCREFDPEWKILASSWQKADKKGSSRVLFTTLDFDNGRNVFMKLQLQTAPVLFLFPPTTGPHAASSGQPLRMDFLGSQSAESTHAWLLRQLPSDPETPYPALKRPVNYTRIVVSITILIGMFTFGTVAYPYVLPVIRSRNLWAAVSLITILLFTSGHMFNHIRKVPYVTGSKGKIVYFAGGFQNQYGMETQIVAAMYAILAFATIALGLKVPRMTDPRMQQIACIIWASVVLGMYSFLMSVFRIKNGGYPFWLPPF